MKTGQSLFFLLFFLVGYTLFAQDHVPIGEGSAMVISSEGLSLREMPGMQAKRLTVMPFGAEVKVVDTADAVLDSLVSTRSMFSGDRKWETEPRKRLGYWVRVRYGNQTGYAFDIFLKGEEELSDMRGQNPDDALAGLDPNFVLLENSAQCRNNLVDNPKYTWYGIYYRDGLSMVKPVQLRQHMERNPGDGFTYAFLHSFADDDLGLLYIIGTRMPFAWGKPSKPNFVPSWYQVDVQSEADMEALFRRLGFTFGRRDLAMANEGWVRYARGGLSQLLNPNDDWYYFSYFGIIADLDGDQRLDFIVHYGEESSQAVLYLSSLARKGELVRPVAVYFDGYCC